MEILVIGNEWNEQECRLKFGDQHQFQRPEIGRGVENDLRRFTLIFDFPGDEKQMPAYKDFEGTVFIDVSKNALRDFLNTTTTKATFFGFVGLPTFLNREVLEVSLAKNADLQKLENICHSLKTKFAVVKDQIGLITSRVICMIINEAYFAIQDNIASRDDIDLAMKLGTNYPFGPFEWCEKIGIRNVFDLLNAVYKSTKDERYKVCDLLKEEAGHLTQRR